MASGKERTTRFYAQLVSPTGIALTFLMLSGIYIFLSDRALAAFVSDADLAHTLQTAKGLVFISFVSLWLYVSIRQSRRVLQRSERQAAARAELLRGILDHIPILIALFDEKDRVLIVNRAWEQTMGWTQKDAQEHPDFIAAIASDADGQRLLRNCVREADAHWHDLNLRARDGNLLAVSCISVHLSDTRRISIVQDVTQRKQYEAGLQLAIERAEEAAHTRATLLSTMSHEIRTPLTAIIGFSELLTETEDAYTQEMAQLIFQSGTRLMETLISVLEFAELEGQHKNLRRQDVDVIALAEEVIQTLMPQATANGNHVYLDATGAVSLVGDARALYRVLMNLISNAIKFTRQGQVFVEVGETDEQVIIAVRDTGIGISPEYQALLFSPFSQESTGLKRTYEGSGLGLAITKRLVGLMGGEIAVQSEKDRGSTFTVILPKEARAALSQE